MVAAFRAEWFKVFRRPSVWVVIGLLIALAVGLGYLVVYLVATHPPAAAQRGTSAAQFAVLRTSVYPASYVKKSLSQTATLDGAFALILGVLLQGSEYGWQTIKTAYMQLPGRLAILAGRVAALALVVLIMTLALFVADAVASYLLALVDGKSTAFPSLADIAKGLAAAWLILGLWAALGFCLATIFRQSAMAIGLGLAYGLVIEVLLFGLLAGLGDAVKHVHVWFPIANAGYLVQAFGPEPGGGGGPAGALASRPDADATHAVLVLLAYLVGLVGVSAALVRRRDVA